MDERTAAFLRQTGLIPTAAAARTLGVKTETLYAYVSRGRLRNFRRAVGRGRLYLERDVDRLLSLLPSRIRGRIRETRWTPVADVRRYRFS